MTVPRNSSRESERRNKLAASQCLTHRPHPPDTELVVRGGRTRLLDNPPNWLRLRGRFRLGSGTQKNLTGLITPIGTLQAGAKKFFSSEYTPDLGVHVPTIAVLLDYYGGWRRPCDGEPYDMSVSSPPRNWGVIPWDLSDFAVDYVREDAFLVVAKLIKSAHLLHQQ